MKNSMTIREKVMLVILGLLCLALVYYYAFYIPTQEEIQQLEEEYLTIDDTLIAVEAKSARLEKMKADLEMLKGSDTDDTKALPAYDNRQNLMSQLSIILAKSDNYNISFGEVSGDGTTVRRNIRLDYTCGSYQAAKALLLEIYNGEYPCAFDSLYLSNEGTTISVDIIYFEYGTLGTTGETVETEVTE